MTKKKDREVEKRKIKFITLEKRDVKDMEILISHIVKG